MPNFVQEYRSTDVGMPTCTGQAASVIGILDACLVNGGATQPVTSLVQSGTTVSAVIPADISLENLDWLTIAGAAPAGANGVVQITFIDSTHFSYQAAAGLGTITGSITYRRAPLGWSKPFSGTNLAAYLARPTVDTACPQMYLRIEEAGLTTGGQKEALATGYEAMSDVNTGTGQFPTNAQVAISGTASRGGLCWRKSATADAVARTWSLIGDGATFYFIANSDSGTTQGRVLNAFGALTSFKVADAFNVLISGGGVFNTTNVVGNLGYVVGPNAAMTMFVGLYVARSMTQAGGSNGLAQMTRWSSTSGTPLGAVAAGTVSYPAPSDASLWVDSTVLFEATNTPRGRPRGIYQHCHNSFPFVSDYEVATNIAGLPGVTLLNILHASGNLSGQAYYDRYGPW